MRLFQLFALLLAAAISGSSSMLSEGVHSLVDSGNQLLLLYGQAQANERPSVPAAPTISTGWRLAVAPADGAGAARPVEIGG